MIKKLILYGAALALVHGLGACDSAPTGVVPTKSGKPPQQAQYDKLVVAFGDSLYAGYRLGATEGFAPVLQAALQKEGINARVHNAGVSGDTSAAGKLRLGFVIDNLERKPDLVIVGLGGNDMLRGIKPAETEANLRAILNELDKRGIKFALTGMLAAPNLGADYARAFNPIYPKLAAAYHAPLYPFFLDGIVTDSALMLPDHIHPNARGVVKIVGALSPLVEKALR